MTLLAPGVSLAPENNIPSCDLLVIVATSSERDALKNVANKKGCDFRRIRKSGIGRYYDLGMIGDERAIAVKTSGMGPLSFRGSADLAMRCRQLTGATAIVQLGMAFGVDPDSQNYGDVLVSSGVIPYDNRDYVETDGTRGYDVDYSRAGFEPAGPIYERFNQESLQNHASRKYSVFTGAILSGSARIFSETFRDELLASVPKGFDPIVGGEMEAVGLLGTSELPIWCVVKGISDFGDKKRHEVIEEKRAQACENATEFFYSTLLNQQNGDIIFPVIN
ncbi:MAG: nucleoside phosphorylase-like protein [Planctomycetota bacterium]